ncbi:MAG: 2-oxo acid dehydrogenase subunit E2 [Bacillaceae bacterium]|nr:2-oxo acid dehydrogenase subunit E2 [Bacillaceae bacterium]
MPTAIKMPQLGESVTEGTISKWLVRKGDKIQQYEPLAEVMTDKVNAEIPSSVSGVVTEITASEDESIEVGGTICIIETETTDNHQTKTSTQDPSQKKRYSPAVLRLAEEHKIDLHAIEGTGRDGRITRKDVLNELNREKVPSMKDLMEVKPVPRTIIEKKTEETTMETNDIVIPVTGVRKKIAENMVRSKHEIPHAWTMVEVDVTNLVKYRNEVKDSFKQKEGYTLTYLPFFIKAIVDALKEYPQINSTWTGDTIIQKKEINISLAVASEDALYVPVIKDADEKTVKGLAKKTNELARKVRTNTITSDDMQGGTFTVNNTGSFGSFLSAPIINYPQAAILSIESIVKRPIVLENDAIAIRHMVNLCLSLDHRILDGLICGRFLAKVKDNLEKISKETTPLY